MDEEAQFGGAEQPALAETSTWPGKCRDPQTSSIIGVS
jgi:hypothetical protein